MLKTNRSAKNLLLSMPENAEVGSIGSGDCEDETVKKLPLTCKNLNGINTKICFKSRFQLCPRTFSLSGPFLFL